MQMESHEDSSYNSGMDSDPESDPDSPEKLLNTWLGELDNLTVVCTSFTLAYCGSKVLFRLKARYTTRQHDFMI